MQLPTIPRNFLCYKKFFILKNKNGYKISFVSILSYGCIKTEKTYLCTLPDPSPPMRAVTSFTETLLKSPPMECFKQLAATANSNASALLS